MVWIYIWSGNQYDTVRDKKVKETIKWLYRSVNDICYHSNMSPIYEIIENDQITYTEKIIKNDISKGIIYLVIWDDTHNRLFQTNTLIYAILHEITHIISPSSHHEAPFDSIENILLNKAIALGYYDRDIPFESHYMTVDLNWSSQ